MTRNPLDGKGVKVSFSCLSIAARPSSLQPLLAVELEECTQVCNVPKETRPFALD